MGTVFATALFGAAADSYGTSALWHHLTALGAIVRNGALIDQILERARSLPQ